MGIDGPALMATGFIFIVGGSIAAITGLFIDLERQKEINRMYDMGEAGMPSKAYREKKLKETMDLMMGRDHK